MTGMRPSSAPIMLAVHWPRFGPYHLARLRAAQAQLNDEGVLVVGLEIASHHSTYLWHEHGAGGLVQHTVLPGLTYEEVPPLILWQRTIAALNTIRPTVIAINGYSSHDAWALLAWSRVHHRPTILMTDSQATDEPRRWWKEWLKRRLVSQFRAALCAGTPHKAYAQQLGLKPGQVFTGYDVVDNDFFRFKAEAARREAGAAQVLPGLEDGTPYFLASARFLPGKNLDGLLRVYAQYRRSFPQSDGLAPWRLVILGDGSERQALHDLADQLHLAGVSWPGFRQIDELPAYYGLAGAFIHPSMQETWGLVVNEAMAAGLPVLVSERCGCAMDLVGQGENGYTFAPQDHDALAKLMLKLSCGQVDLAAMGRASLARIAGWGLDRFTQGLGQALAVALCGAQRPA